MYEMKLTTVISQESGEVAVTNRGYDVAIHQRYPVGVGGGSPLPVDTVHCYVYVKDPELATRISSEFDWSAVSTHNEITCLLASKMTATMVEAKLKLVDIEVIEERIQAHTAMARSLFEEGGQELLDQAFALAGLPEVDESELEPGTYTNRQLTEMVGGPMEVVSLLMRIERLDADVATKRSILSFAAEELNAD